MMNVRFLSSLAVVLCAAAVATGCSDSPSSPSGAAGSVTSPLPAQPAANATVRFADQPITLMVRNAATTGSGTVYTFEVATDAAFASRVQTKDNVAEGANGQTTVRLDALTGGRDYYWHARATSGGTAGPFSPPVKFTVGPPVVVNPPTPIAPLNGTTIGQRAAFRVTNATRTNAGAIQYRFEIATTSAFTTIVASATVGEGINETGFIPTSNLPVATLVWRATAIDAATGVASDPSTPQSVTVRAFSQAEAIAFQLGEALWPGNQPGGSFGHATMGDDRRFGEGWQIQTLFYVPGNVRFQSPDIEMLRYFDLFDRGYDPEGAIQWLRGNGYPTDAQWYPPPEKAVLGLHYVYLAARGKVTTNGIWDVVLRIE